MTIIAVVNQKGGVGKTTTAVTLAHGLACDSGKRILLIDLDTQGNVSDALGIPKSGALMEWLMLEKPITEVAYSARPMLDVIRSDKSTVRLKISLAGMDFREKVIARALKEYEKEYETVILDCAPSVDLLQIAALMAADLVIIPTKLDQFSVTGVVETIKSVRTVQEEAGRIGMGLAGIIPTFYDRVTTESHEQLKALATAFGAYVWPAVPQDTICREGSRLGRTVWEIGMRGKAAGAYREILDRLEKMI